MFDTHAHLNFSRFKKNVGEVIARAKEAGVDRIVVPGTDIPSSKNAIELTEQYEGLYAAVGIHPHHGFEYYVRHPEGGTTEARLPAGQRSGSMRSFAYAQDDIDSVEQLLNHSKVVAVGEIGMYRHEYGITK